MPKYDFVPPKAHVNDPPNIWQIHHEFHWLPALPIAGHYTLAGDWLSALVQFHFDNHPTYASSAS
jgi:hypothetical protein